ncbi:MAG: hypothetical protein WCB46_07960 [Methanoregula sp.]
MLSSGKLVFKGLSFPTQTAGCLKPGGIVISDERIITPLENPVGILVHRSPLRARLYLFSPDPWIWEVIIRKNAEQNPEQLA